MEPKKINPQKFEAFLWSEDFYERYVVPTKIQDSNIDTYSKNKEAALRLWLRPERELKGLTQFLNSYKKIWISAHQKNNEEISLYIVYQLKGLLRELVQEPDNHLFVEEFLRLLNVITYTGVKNAKIRSNIDPSIYSAAIYWYRDIIFNPFSENKYFHVSYIELFNRYFLFTVKYIISENQAPIFHVLVSYLVDNIYIVNSFGVGIRKYVDLIFYKHWQEYNQLNIEYGIEARVKELDELENNLYSQENLKAWFKKFDELKAIIEPNLDNEQKKSAQEIEEKIVNFVVSKFKYYNLQKIVFIIGAYCLFSQRYDYIKYLWEYKQPPDSDASWIGADIIPLTLNETVKLYFCGILSEKRFDFWEGYHGSEKYYSQYLILLLANILRNFLPNAEGKYSQIENYRLPQLHIYSLSDIEHSTDELIKVATELKKDRSLLAKIGFDKTKLDEIFDQKVVPFLKKLKEEAANQISKKLREEKISLKKVEEFKKEVLKSFYEYAILRDIFIKYFKRYRDKTKEIARGKTEYIRIDTIVEKEVFFEEWHVQYIGVGENIGQTLAAREDFHLLDDITNSCEEIGEKDFEPIFSKFHDPNDIVIFTTSAALWDFFHNTKSFKPNWYKDIKQLEIKGFAGWYDFKSYLIPVFEINYPKIDRLILILNKIKIGELIQFSPINKGEEKYLEDIFYMDIQAFSENKELMEEFIKSPPEWLIRIGDEQKQREYLKKHVRIKIFEQFEFKKTDDFEGYKLLLKS
ncbi:hypothetical protein [Anaerocellum danielii]|uniref:Uncharacterized protein n=1 Tax=Anaerocellum danielii TaxID=1387557 RepID=A0ABZ0TXV9_9FIRM|nr:hypothetical protein [Caldicellulosiruptor danielii]WPX08074.1 hypothetical protein SOJ16_001928 [Caldicellulosiruptor danielii]